MYKLWTQLPPNGMTAFKIKRSRVRIPGLIKLKNVQNPYLCSYAIQKELSSLFSALDLALWPISGRCYIGTQRQHLFHSKTVIYISAVLHLVRKEKMLRYIKLDKMAFFIFFKGRVKSKIECQLFD